MDEMVLKPKPKKPQSRSRFNTFVLIVGVIEPLFTLPQVWQIWVDKETAGVSAPTWFFFTLIGIVWVIYGFQQKDKPLIVSSILWVILEGAVFLGVVVR